MVVFCRENNFSFYFIAKCLGRASPPDLVSWIVALRLRLNLKHRAIQNKIWNKASCAWHVADNKYDDAAQETEAGENRINVTTATMTHEWPRMRVSRKRGPQQPRRESITPTFPRQISRALAEARSHLVLLILKIILDLMHDGYPAPEAGRREAGKRRRKSFKHVPWLSCDAHTNPGR